MHYPPVEDSDLLKPGLVRLHSHCDFLTITLLLQDDVGGLEVKSGDEWIQATPIPGTILVNLGEMMQFWTADRYVATVILFQ